MAPSFSSLGRHSTGKYSISPQGKHFCLLSFFSFLNPSKIDFSQPTKVNSREKRKKNGHQSKLANLKLRLK
jgi:hypothetical protein